MSQRLDRVSIERLDWREFLDRYDHPDTCFYVDPPYTAGVQYSPGAWGEAEHRELRDRLARIRGSWLLSYDDSPLVRCLYAGCGLTEITRATGINNRLGRTGRTYRELLIAPILSAQEAA